MKTIVIVHGEKPTRSGTIHRELIRRLEAAAAVCQRERIEAVVITGGQTRAHVATEAAMGADFLRGRVTVPIIREEKSRTTSENISCTKQLLRQPFESVRIIDSQKLVARLKYLYRVRWPEAYRKATFIGVPDSYPWIFRLQEWLYFLYSRLDPRDRGLVRLSKKVFRNY